MAMDTVAVYSVSKTALVKLKDLLLHALTQNYITRAAL